MKTITEVRTGWKCSNGHDKKHYFFNAENAHCEECESPTCSGDYDLGPHKYD